MSSRQQSVRLGRISGQPQGGGLRLRIPILFLTLLAPFALRPAPHAYGWSEVSVPSLPGDTPENREAGKNLYGRFCASCHGEDGNGDGPAAEYLDPRPRNLTSCTFKLRTTKSGEMPTDADLFRSVANGLNGTAMPSWKNRLRPEQIGQVIAYIKTFCPDFKDPEFDPDKQMVKHGKAPSASRDLLERGRQLFDEQKCWECHGRNGRGFGEKAFQLSDDWGDPILPRNLTAARTYRGGATVEDIFLRFTTGINGTPMPSFETLGEQDRWVLAHYVHSLADHSETERTVLEMHRVETVPEDPWDRAWDDLEPIHVLLSGQVIKRPRWQNPAIDRVTVRGSFTDKEVAFLLEWDDRTESRQSAAPPDFDSYHDTQWKPDRTAERYHAAFSDTVSLQFPLKPSDGPENPHFFWGSPNRKVEIWEWMAATEADGSGSREYVGSGYRKPLDPQSVTTSRAHGVWREGQWRVLFTRPLRPGNRDDHAPIEAGRLTPFAIQVRDGSSGEVGPLLALSSWYHLALKSPIPRRAYLFAFLSIVLTFAFEGIILNRIKRRAKGR